jgi:iron complex outermembrane recepter protein
MPCKVLTKLWRYKIIAFASLLAFNNYSLAAENIDLDTVEVIASPVEDSTTATLNPTAVFDLPLSVTPLHIEDFTERAPKDIADLADYSAGVSRRANYWGVNTPTFQLRGFNAGDATAYYKDGFRYQGRGPMSMANVEGIEILRGPVNALYGWNEAGGAVQVLVKKPSKHTIANVSLQFDAWDKAIATLDFGGALNDIASYRLVMAREQGGSFRDNQDVKQTLFAPTIDIEFANNKKFELGLEFLDDIRTTDYGIPAFNGKPANVPVERIYTEDFGRQHSRSTRLSARWQQPAWGGDLHAAISYYQFKYLDYKDAEPYKVSGTQVLRTYEDYPEQYKWITAYVDWATAFNTGSLKHNFAARFEAAREKRTLNNGVFDEYPAIDIFNPTYNQTYTPTADYNLFSQGWRNSQYGLALQDDIQAGNWHFLLGLRQNYIHQTHYLIETLPVAINNHTTQSDSDLTPRIGMTWQANENLNVYANYSSGKMAVLPQNRSISNSAFSPTSSKQLELGIKVQPDNKSWLASAAIFNIERSNVLTRDPDNAGFSVQTGKQQSKGLELEFQGNIASNWRLTAQTTLLDAFLANDNRYKVGNRLPYAARVGASAWLTHQLFFDDAQLSLSGGLVYQGNRYADFANATQIPSYTRVDLGASYRTKNWTTTLSLENAFDKEYYTSGVENRPAVIYPGASRTLAVKVNYSFE